MVSGSPSASFESPLQRRFRSVSSSLLHVPALHAHASPRCSPLAIPLPPCRRRRAGSRRSWQPPRLPSRKARRSSLPHRCCCFFFPGASPCVFLFPSFCSVGFLFEHSRGCVALLLQQCWLLWCLAMDVTGQRSQIWGHSLRWDHISLHLVCAIVLVHLQPLSLTSALGRLVTMRSTSMQSSPAARRCASHFFLTSRFVVIASAQAFCFTLSHILPRPCTAGHTQGGSRHSSEQAHRQAPLLLAHHLRLCGLRCLIPSGS